VPAAIKINALNKAIRKLFMHKTSTEAHGTEFWIAAVNPFGWTPSEWGWQCILAILLWEFRRRNFYGLLAYVDNFFLIRPASSASDSITRLSKIFEEIVRSTGLDLHEKQAGTHFMVWGGTSTPSGC